MPKAAAIALSKHADYGACQQMREAIKMLTVAAAAGNVMFYGWLGWLLGGRLGTPDQARFAGLFLAIGFATGSFGGHAGTEVESILAFRGGGYLLGIVVSAGLLFHPRFSRLRRKS